MKIFRFTAFSCSTFLVTVLSLLMSSPEAMASDLNLPIRAVVKIISGESVTGSGVVLDTNNGYILTNAHVVVYRDTYEPYDSYTVCVVTSEKENVHCDFTADLLYADIEKDMAVLKISGNVSGVTQKPFIQPSVSLKSSLPSIGDPIHALGFPSLGGNTITVSQGIVSGFYTFDTPDGGTLHTIKTDSNIISGNSGGLMVDKDGKFVGVPSAYFSNYKAEKIGIVISASDVNSWFNSIQDEIGQGVFQAPKIVVFYPGVVANIDAKKDSSTSVQLSWGKPLSTKPIDHYVLVWGTDSFFETEYQEPEDFTDAVKTPDSSTTYTVENLEAGKVYYFSVAAVTADGHFSTDWAEFATLNLASGEPTPPIFSDVPNNYKHAYAIAYLKSNSVVTGYPDETFRPDTVIKRAELLKIVVLSQGVNPKPEQYNGCFQDVHDEWFASYICYAKEKDWVGGYGDDTFKPGQDITLAESLKIILKANEMPLDKVKLDTGFPEGLKNQWFTSYVAMAHEMSILSDKLPSLNIHEHMSRARASEILYRTMLIANYKNTYDSKVWKIQDNGGTKTFDPAMYSGLENTGTKKFQVTVGDTIAHAEQTLKKGCILSKQINCYTISSKDSDGKQTQLEEKIIDNALRLLNVTLFDEEENKTVVYDEPSIILPNQNVVEYIRSKDPVLSEFDGMKMLVEDGIQTFELLGQEKVTVPAGTYDTVKIKSVGILYGFITLKDGSESAIKMRLESTGYFAKNVGQIKSITAIIITDLETNEKIVIPEVVMEME